MWKIVLWIRPLKKKVGKHSQVTYLPNLLTSRPRWPPWRRAVSHVPSLFIRNQICWHYWLFTLLYFVNKSYLCQYISNSWKTDMKYARFQASASMWLSTSLFWDMTQRVLVLTITRGIITQKSAVLRYEICHSSGSCYFYAYKHVNLDHNIHPLRHASLTWYNDV